MYELKKKISLENKRNFPYEVKYQKQPDRPLLRSNNITEMCFMSPELHRL